MSLELRSGAQHFVEAVCHAPYDSLPALINALATLLLVVADTSVTVSWGVNPDELDFTFTARGAELTLEVVWYRDHGREPGTGEPQFSYRGPKFDVCRAFWRALRALQTNAEVDEFARNWRREFPARELQALTQLVEPRKRAERPAGA
jgi:hypothetical protein